MAMDQPFPNNTYSGSYDLRGNAQDPLLTLSHGVAVEFTLGTETAGDTLDVDLQFVDGYGQPVTEKIAFQYYCSTTAAGDVVDAAFPGDMAIQTDGTIIVEHTTDVVGLAVTEADGTLTFRFTGDTGGDATFLNVILPNGTVAVSDEIEIVAD